MPPPRIPFCPQSRTLPSGIRQYRLSPDIKYYIRDRRFYSCRTTAENLRAGSFSAGRTGTWDNMPTVLSGTLAV